MSSVEIYKLPKVVQASMAGLGAFAVVNRTDFSISKNISNDIEFIIKDSERRLMDVSNSHFSIMFSSDEYDELLLTKSLVNINPIRGHVRLNLTAQDIDNFPLGMVRYSIVADVNTNPTLLYTDQQHGYVGWVEVNHGPIPVPKEPQTLLGKDFMKFRKGELLEYYTASYALQGNSRIALNSAMSTMFVNSSGPIKNFTIQASLSNLNPVESDWFDIDVRDIDSGPNLINLVGNYQWIRVYYKLEEESGNVEKLVYRA